MPLKTRLNDDLKDAMRKREMTRRDTVRLLLSAIHNEEIAKQSELDDDSVIQVLSRQAQQRRDSIEAYQKASRQDLVEKEQGELAIIQEYLPRQMSRDEVAEVVRQAIADVGAAGPQDMGKVMGKVMPQVRGRAEGREVNAVVNEMLRGLAG